MSSHKNWAAIMSHPFQTPALLDVIWLEHHQVMFTSAKAASSSN